MAKKNTRRPARKLSKHAGELACEEPKPLQEESTLKEAGETMRSLQTDTYPVAAGDHLVGTVEGKLPAMGTIPQRLAFEAA